MGSGASRPPSPTIHPEPPDYPKHNGHLQKYSWYFGNMSRTDANIMLKETDNGPGSFLIRESSRDNELCLSVRSIDNTIRHYIIEMCGKSSFYIEEKMQFPGIADLVKFYSDRANRLCIRLDSPPTKISKVTTTSIKNRRNGCIEIDKRSLKLKHKISEGNFGEVYEAKWQGVTVAVKVLKTGSMKITDFRRESETMTNLSHPNVIRMYGVCMQDEPFYIVTEFMNTGDLRKYVIDHPSLSTNHLIRIASQVASGMEYLEKKNCIHRDLAARNVLLGNDGNFLVKIADFGMARIALDDDIYTTRKDDLFPIKWTAPEAVHKNQFSIKSDVWSFGILLMEIFTHGTVPYPDMDNKETLRRVARGYRMPCPDGCPVTVHTIMMQCWATEPNQRPSFRELARKIRTLNSSEISSWTRSKS